ncbi:MAG: hypothetical protein JRI25_04505 [Deltaproteobacteria bacterium]|nr:hypothetical protein [Deltaproteobacteria bacterium]
MHRFFLLPLFLGLVACTTESTIQEEAAVETTEAAVETTEAAIDVAASEEATTEAAIDETKKVDKYGDGHDCGECAGCAEGIEHDHQGS